MVFQHSAAHWPIADEASATSVSGSEGRVAL